MASFEPRLEQRLRDTMGRFTPAERRLGAVLTRDYPVSGLGTVSELADAAGVSAPTVVRMARKLGFAGFAELQRAIREEVAARIAGPPDVPTQRGEGRTHPIHRFVDAVAANVRATLARLDTASFDAMADLLADASRPVLVAGGRITRPLADHLAAHLQFLRPRVGALGTASNLWPQAMVDVGPESIVVLIDIRRYEAELFTLAGLAAERGATLLLFTDPFGSPISRHARHRLEARLEVPSSWDSVNALLLLIEALVAAVEERRWHDSHERMDAMEAMFRRTRLFRDPG